MIAFIWTIIGGLLFLKSLNENERMYFMDDFKNSNTLGKVLIIFLDLFIIIIYPIVKLCEIIEWLVQKSH